ncbi:MAG TPA: sensor histidine kinase [Ohtaekwangia sp.]
MRSSDHAFGFLFLVTSLALQAQEDHHYTDSLLQISTASRDSAALQATMHLYRYYFNRGDRRSSLRYCKDALQRAFELGDFKKVPRITYGIGLNFIQLFEYDSARIYLEKVEAMLSEKPDPLLRILSYNAQGMLRDYQSDYDGASQFYFACANYLQTEEAGEFKNLLPQTYCHLGYSLINEDQVEKGIEYELKALPVRGYPDELRYRILIHLNLSDGYVKLKKLSQAKIHLDSAILLKKDLDHQAVAGMIFMSEGFYYRSVPNNAKATEAYARAYATTEAAQSSLLKAESGNDLAELYLLQGNYSQAEKYAAIANTIARKQKQFKIASGTYNVLKELASRKGNYAGALEYAEWSRLYADSATNVASKLSILTLESKYQNQKKEKEIAELTLTNTQNQLTVVKQNRYIMMGSIAAVAVLVIVVLLYRSSKQKQSLAEQKQKIQEQQIEFLERQQKVVSLQSMINGQETERTRIAKDLHDGLGGLFSTIKMYFSTLQHDMAVLKEDSLFQKSYGLIDNASVELRRIAHNMMPEVLMKLGLTNALKDLCDNISAGKLIKVSLEVHGMTSRLNEQTEVMLYRIVQELLNNIIKHAQATEVIIQFVKDNNRLSVVVEDNGKGFNTQEADTRAHAGLETVKNRVNYLNGELTIDSEKGVGTTVMMEFLINE